MPKNWKYYAVTGLALFGAWTLYQNHQSGRGLFAKMKQPVESEAVKRFRFGAKAQADAAKVAALGSELAAKQAEASASVVKS